MTHLPRRWLDRLHPLPLHWVHEFATNKVLDAHRRLQHSFHGRGVSSSESAFRFLATRAMMGHTSRNSGLIRLVLLFLSPWCGREYPFSAPRLLEGGALLNVHLSQILCGRKIINKQNVSDSTNFVGLRIEGAKGHARGEQALCRPRTRRTRHRVLY